MESQFPSGPRQVPSGQLIQLATQGIPRCGPLKSDFHQLQGGKAQPHTEYEISRQGKFAASQTPSTNTDPKNPAHIFSTLRTLKGHEGGWYGTIRATFLGRNFLTVYGKNQRTALSLVYKESPRASSEIYRLWRHTMVTFSLTTVVLHKGSPNTHSYLLPTHSPHTKERNSRLTILFSS